MHGDSTTRSWWTCFDKLPRPNYHPALLWLSRMVFVVDVDCNARSEAESFGPEVAAWERSS